MSSPDKSKSRLFLAELAQFYRSKGQMGVTPQHLVARLDGQEVDLCHLYSAVLEMGGSYRVNQQSQWDQVYARLFGSNSNDDPDRRSVIGVNISVALRQIYQKYLMPYERIHFSNFAHDVADDDEDESRPNHFSNSNSGSSNSNKDPTASFVIHSSLTQHHPPQKHPHHVDPLTRLFCALVSGLANEMEFGLRVVTMLVNSRQIDAIADLKLVDVLLECCSLSLCHCHSSDDQQQSIRRSHPATGSQQQQQQQLLEKKCVCESRFWSRKCKDESIAALLLDDLTDDCSLVLADEDEEQDQKITDKVKRIADLIRTITESIQEYQEADEESPCESAAPPRLVRFAGLMLSSDDSEFKSLALEIISNINLIGSHQFRDDECQAALVNSIICHCIRLVVDDNDVSIVRRSIRTLAHIAALAADEPNNAFEQLIDESQIVSRMIELLTCQQDVSLLTATLEFCWTISENRPKLLTRSSHGVNQLLKILINLLNCEANSHFTPQALKHVRVRDLRNRSQVRVTSASQPLNAVPQQTVRVALQPATGSGNNNTGNNNLTILSESESFAISWLKGLYESGPRTQSVSLSEMYTEYIKTSCKSGRKNVVGAQSFSQIIVRTFPSATVTPANVVEGLTIRPSTPRKTQNQPQQQQQPLTSPILKAHLCAPPKTSPTSTLTAASLTTSTTAASTSNCTTPTTTLIKSLLANKLRGNSQINLLKAEAAGGDAIGSDVKSSTKSPVTSNSVSVSHVLCQNQNVLTSSPQSVLISTPSAGGSGLPGQGPQQFLLVRTIIQPGSNQTSGMRLILPASVITPQRPPVAAPAVTVNGNGLAPSPPAPAGHSNDILLKAVLGSGIVAETAGQSSNSESPKNCVKSSPLLNVLLDKGKFPESSASLTATTNSGSQTQSHDRVYILTTGSPLKSSNDTSSLRNGTVSDGSAAAPVKLKPAATIVNSHSDSSLTNGDISGYHHNCNEDKKSNAMPITDLSPITDIQKAVDDAPKLISKRAADDAGHQTPSKKSKADEVSDAVVSRETPKAVTKILPVNGEVRLPPKASPEKASPEVVTQTVAVPAPNPVPVVVEYLCEWHECKRSFTRASHVFKHVYECHVFGSSGSSVPRHCMWGGSEGMGPGCLSERPQLSLLTHLQDFHCSPTILQQAALKRQQFGNNNVPAAPVVPVSAPPAHPGYAQNAALLAIRRLNCVEPFTVPAATPTTPITVSIRLTAALIIRNVATISSDARRFLQRYERFLSEMCVAPGRDESRTIAQCLALIQNVIWRR